MISDRENKKRLFSRNRCKFNGEYDKNSYKWESNLLQLSEILQDEMTMIVSAQQVIVEIDKRIMYK